MDLLARIEANAHRAPDHDAYRLPSGERLTYRELLGRIAYADGQLATLTRPGDRIVLHAGNGLAFPILFLGGIAAGVEVLALPLSATPAEITRFAGRVRASLIATATPAAFGRDAAEPPVMHVEQLTSATVAPQLHERVSTGALLLASSGSTGEPKIVRRDAPSLTAVSANMVDAIRFEPRDRVLAAVPLAHSYGIEHGLLAPLWAGSTVHLFDGLDLDAINATEDRLTIFPAVPSMLERLAEMDVRTIAGLETIYSAGAPLPDAVRTRFVTRYGRPVGQLYGASEIGTVTYRAGSARPGPDVGWPMNGVSVRILETGEVAIRSPSMFSGYLDEPAPPLIDGHFLTGDLGHLTDDNALVITGRSKLLIDIGGLKVNPREVEAVMIAHAEVRECVVVPLPQSETVSRLRAIIVPRNPAAPPAIDALRSHARAHLAAHKVPRMFELRAELPRSATGKVLRTMLNDA